MRAAIRNTGGSITIGYSLGTVHVTDVDFCTMYCSIDQSLVMKKITYNIRLKLHDHLLIQTIFFFI